MRIFSRIGSWLRARGTAEAPLESDTPDGTPPSGTAALPPPLTIAHPLDHETLARLPRATADLFRQRLLDSIRAAHDEARVQIATLDPSMRVLVLSQQANSGSDDEIDAALRQVESGAQNLSSVTWSALRDARPPFRPAPPDWGGNLAHHLDGDAGLIFFVDVEAIALSVVQAAEAQGLAGHIEEDGGLVRVSDGRFHAHVGTSALIAEALWTGTGPLSVVMRRAQQLPNEMRSFVAVLRGLERRFPGVRFEVAGDRLLARTARIDPVHPGPARIDYRHLAAGARASGTAIDVFLKGARLDDLSEQVGDVAMLVRSPAYKKAYPDVVSAEQAGSLLVAVREEGGRAVPIRKHDDDAPERFDFLQAEARRQLPFLRLDGHAFVVEQSSRQGALAPRAYGFVGDKAASLLLDPTLVRGFCEQLGPVPHAVDVVTLSENALIVAAPNTNEVVIEEARRRASRLEVDLFDDGADALSVSRRIDMPAVGGGCFELTIVPDEFFTLSDQAIESGDLGRAHADYLRGLALEALGLTEKAARAFERAVRARSDDGELNLALGRALSALGEHTRAVSILERAAGAMPDHPEVQNALGLALYRTGAAGDARVAFLRAVKLAPDEVGFLVNLGRTCCDERLYGEAKSALEHALRVEPTSAEAHASMAVLCHRTGERQRALHHARAALAEQPDDETVRELLRMMDDDS
ncbi:MAG: tetratricopeptide repeat protein [Deltaproteobacteria bacterium]|nr:tetratricopeptide repeat protein [Deltaproteobacteria bacterium]